MIGSDLETHLLVYCPFHYNINTPACEVDKEKGLFFCFSCQESGNLTDFVMRSTGRNYFEAARMINSKKTDFNFHENILKTVEKKDISEFDIELINRLHRSMKISDVATEYLVGRGITEDSIETFKIGFSEKQEMVTVPVQDHTGMYVGFVGRSISGKSFKNSSGLPRRHVLFNLNRNKYSSVCVVESSFDAIKLHQIGIPAVATLGSYISKEQIELLNKWTDSVIIIPDKDEAGEKLVSKIVKNYYKPITVVNVPEGKKDVGDMTTEEILKIMKESTSILV